MLTRLTNVRVVTLDPRQPSAEAVLVAADRILAVGSDAQLRETAPNAVVVDLQGQVLFPGFIEPHSHVLGYGLAESRAAVFYNRNLAPVTSREQLLHVVGEAVADVTRGEWITGRGFACDRWPDRTLLTREELDAVSPENPVALNDLGGHLLLCNSLALRLGKVSANTTDPVNGIIHRDASGTPAGPLNDGAMLPVFSQIPTPKPEELVRAAKVAAREMVRMGITTVHHIRNWLPGGYGPEQVRPFIDLARTGELPLRVWLMVEAYENIAKVGDYTYIDSLAALGMRTGLGDRVKIGPVKIIVDGWLDARSSAQYEAYADRPGQCGYTWREADVRDYEQLVWRAHRAGFQLAIHCDGLRSTDIILDAYEHALHRMPRDAHRHRFEHVPVLTDEQIERIARLGVSVCSVPSYRMEPWHKAMTVRAFGEARAHDMTLRYRSLKQAGVHLFGGSDCHPCEEQWLSPIGQIYLNSVEGPLNSAERLSRADAVAMFTTEAAKASFEEDVKGRIAPGMLADLVVLTEDPLGIADEALRDIRVMRTIVGGETVYDRDATR